MSKKNYRFYIDTLGIKLCEENVSPIKDAINPGDCAVRSITKLTGKDYREVYKDLADIGRELCVIMNSHQCIKPYMIKQGYSKVCNFSCRTVGEFMYNHKVGRYLIITDRHAAAYIDGVWYDKDIDYMTDSFLISILGMAFYKPDYPLAIIK